MSDSCPLSTRNRWPIRATSGRKRPRRRFGYVLLNVQSSGCICCRALMPTPSNPQTVFCKTYKSKSYTEFNQQTMTSNNSTSKTSISNISNGKKQLFQTLQTNSDAIFALHVATKTHITQRCFMLFEEDRHCLYCGTHNAELGVACVCVFKLNPTWCVAANAPTCAAMLNCV